MKGPEIVEIANQYGIELWFGFYVTAKFLGKPTDLMKRGQAYRTPEEEWHCIFQKIVNASAVNYWTSASKTERDVIRKLRMDTDQARCKVYIEDHGCYKEVQG